MKEKIIVKGTDLFLKLGFKSVTMDDIAAEMGISKKTIYKYFSNKEILIEETVAATHEVIDQSIAEILSQNHNPIKENFEIRKMFKTLFQAADTSPLYQLKKHYPDIHAKMMCKETDDCNRFLKQNIEKGIEQGLYRADVNIELVTRFYYTLIFQINENTISEREIQELEFAVLEYHTRAIATEKGIAELEKNLTTPNQ